MGEYVSIALEGRRNGAYGSAMDTVPDKAPPRGIVESLERSEAQIAAGLTVPMEPVLDRLRESIARMKARRSPTGPKVAREA